MTRDAPVVAAERASAWQMYRAMVGVGLACGLAIVTAYQTTLPRIERNRAAALERAIFQVLPAAETRATFPLDDGARVHAGYGPDGALIGVAVETEGMGYQDVIRILYGYAPERQAIVGLQVLESRETPGLGTRIETDPGFLANFERLDVSLDATGTSLTHPIEGVANGTKRHPWQIDAITGATISSRAVADMLARSAAEWVPRIAGDLDAFATPPTAGSGEGT